MLVLFIKTMINIYYYVSGEGWIQRSSKYNIKIAQSSDYIWEK